MQNLQTDNVWPSLWTRLHAHYKAEINSGFGKQKYLLPSNNHLRNQLLLHLLLYKRAHAQDIDKRYSHIEYFECLDGDFQVIHAVMT